MSVLKPRILALDLTDESINRLSTAGLNISKGSLGKIVYDINTTNKSPIQIEFEGRYPENVHEFDILIVDLNNPQREPYELYLERTKFNRGERDYFDCEPDTRTFDERLFTLSLLKEKIQHIKNRPVIVILFAGPNEKDFITYVQLKNKGTKREDRVVELYGICSHILPVTLMPRKVLLTFRKYF